LTVCHCKLRKRKGIKGMTTYKVLALDLDGTLLTDEKMVTEETKLWLQRAVDIGVTVMFSTGRGVQTVEAIRKELGLSSPMVLLNGAEVWESPGLLWKRTLLPRETVRMMHGLAVQKGAVFWAYSVESLTGHRKWDETMFEREWMKFGIRHDNPAVLCQIRDELLRWNKIEVTSSAPVNLEISAKGISKESGVREACRRLSVAMEDVMAIGDSENDRNLLLAAGLGVAMDNSDDGIKAIAGACTDSNNRNGVAKAIQRFIFGLEVPDIRV
jgi:HAD superfamily hydrolase (TIGR01484 family)